MAGEGILRERGLRPLSNFYPLLEHNKKWSLWINQFERGIKGVSINNQC
jgi:hypothetical protein